MGSRGRDMSKDATGNGEDFACLCPFCGCYLVSVLREDRCSAVSNAEVEEPVRCFESMEDLIGDLKDRDTT